MNFYVNPDQLQVRGGAIEDAGASSAGDLSALHSQTTAAPGVWGTDDAGTQLGVLYQELTALTGEAVDLLSGGVQDTGAGVRRIGGGFQDTDTDAGSRIGGSR
jgi:hypothetical protein